MKIRLVTCCIVLVFAFLGIIICCQLENYLALIVLIMLEIFDFAYIALLETNSELLAALKSTFEEESRYHTKYVKLLEHYRKMFQAIQEEHPDIDETHPQYNALANEMLADVVDNQE